MPHQPKVTALFLVCLLCFAPVSHAQLLPITYLFNKVLGALNSQGAANAAREERRKQALTSSDLKRGIPEESILATMSPPQGRLVEMDNNRMRLAPAAKIKDTKNRTILPGRIQRDMEVRFVADRNGDIRTVWLLADDYYTTVAKTTSKRRGSSARDDNTGRDSATR